MDALELLTADHNRVRGLFNRSPDLGPSDQYETDWAGEVERSGPDGYYPLDM